MTSLRQKSPLQVVALTSAGRRLKDVADDVSFAQEPALAMRLRAILGEMELVVERNRSFASRSQEGART